MYPGTLELAIWPVFANATVGNMVKQRYENCLCLGLVKVLSFGSQRLPWEKASQASLQDDGEVCIILTEISYTSQTSTLWEAIQNYSALVKIS